MRVVIGADHRGYPLKQHLAGVLAERGHSVIDVGTHSEDSVDYPDISAAVARAVVEGRADRGIVICGSGAGAVVAANKVRGVRCTLAHDTYTAHQGVEHDDINVIAMGSGIIGSSLADEVVEAFLDARFQPEERYVRRLDKITALEESF